MDYFSKNLKFLRKKKGISVEELSEKIKIHPATIYRWENSGMGVTIKNANDVAVFFGVTLADLTCIDLSKEYLKQFEDARTSSIPVLGTIKAGQPIEAQTNILEYIDIPIRAMQGGRKYFALKISGDSMYPKYQDDDIVIFEQTNDIENANNKDCAILINNDDATFKNLSILEDGIVLSPLNTLSYQPKFYTKEQVANLPIKILGVARERRTKL